MLNKKFIEVVIVGGGQAGVALSYYLQQSQIPHYVLEQNEAFSSWHKRWQDFTMNTPNWMNTLPGTDPSKFPGNDQEGFASKTEIIEYLEHCLKEINPPIITNTKVHKVAQLNENIWEVYTHDTVYQTQNVAICTGWMRLPKLPKEADSVPHSVPQLHSSEYQHPEQIKTDSVLLVGSGSSGMNICRLLCESGRFDKIYLAASNVFVFPTQILGIQVHRFLHFFGLFDLNMSSLLGRVMSPFIKTGGDPIIGLSPKDLAKLYDVHLYGRFLQAEDSLLYFSDNQTLKTDGLTIIWCTGYRTDYSFINTQKDDLFDKFGNPNHNRGVMKGASGLYFVGLRFQTSAASTDLYGVGKDAEYLAHQISKRLN